MQILGIELDKKRSRNKDSVNACDHNLHIGNGKHSSRVKGKTIRASLVLNDFRRRHYEMESRIQKAKAQSPDSQVSDTKVIYFNDSPIMDRIKVKPDGNDHVLDADVFYIRNEYLPTDDNAPQRLYDIACDIMSCINSINHNVKANADKAVSAGQQLPVGLLVFDPESNKLKEHIGNDEYKTVTSNTLSVDQVIGTLFFTDYAQPHYMSQAVDSEITVQEHGCLPEMTFQANPKGELELTNNNLQGEVKQLWDTLFPVLLPKTA